MTLQPHQILHLPHKINVISALRTYETSFPMRGASQVTLQLHQILRLPHQMNVINDLRHIWIIISNARSKQNQPGTSPNTAPATQNECHQWSASHMKRHFQCVEQVKSPSNLTKYCACHEILKLKISADTPWMFPPIERRFEDIRRYPTIIRRYPTIIRRYPTIKSSSRTRRFGDLPDPILETLFYCKIQHFAFRLSPKMSRSTAPVTKSHTPTSANTTPATQLYRIVTVLNCDFAELLLDWRSITLRIYDFTDLWLYGSITLRIYDFTDLWLYETSTLRIYYFTNLWLYGSMTLRN